MVAEIRCPDNESKLFLRLVDGHLEVACYDCRRKLRRADPDVMLVLHRYDMAGDYLDTSTLRGVKHAPRT